MSEAYEARGLKFRIGRWRIRIWLRGWEYDDGMYGRIYLFPWAKLGLRKYK